MSNFWKEFEKEETIYASVIKLSDIYDADTGQSTESEIYGSSIKGIFWENSVSNSFYASQSRDRRVANFITSPDSVVNKKDLLVIDGERWIVLSPNNVAGQNEVKVVELEEIA